MSTTQTATTLHTTHPKTVSARQIAFAAAFLLPAAKFLEAPSLLARYAEGDLLLPATLHFLLQTLILCAVLFTCSKSDIPLLTKLRQKLGKFANLFFAAYAAYYTFAALLPLLDAEKFTHATFYDTAPTLFTFGVFFLFSAFVCTKTATATGRCADLCLFLFLLPFLALAFMSISKTDFRHLRPFFSAPPNDVLTAFLKTTPHFSDIVLLLPMLLQLRYQPNDGKKIVGGYTLGAVFTLLFLAIFYGLFGAIASREHYAFAKIGQYFPALSVVGRIDLLFVYLLSVVLFFYTTLPMQYAAQSLTLLSKTENTLLPSLSVNLLLGIAVLFLNQRYNAIYTLFTTWLTPVFGFFADIFPCLLLLLPNNCKPLKTTNYKLKSQ